MHNLQDVHGSQRLDNPGCEFWVGGVSVGGLNDVRSGRTVDKLINRLQDLVFTP